MAVRFYLLLITFVAVYACKSRFRERPEDRTENMLEVTTDYVDYYEDDDPEGEILEEENGDEEEGEDEQQEEEEEEEVESEEHPYLPKATNYLALIINNQGLYSTGIRILPYVVTMSRRYFGGDSIGNHYKVSYNGTVKGDKKANVVKLTGRQVHFTGLSEKHWFLTLSLKPDATGKVVEYGTISLDTRTDRYSHEDCWIKATGKHMKALEFRVNVISASDTEAPECKLPYRICAVPHELHCFPAEGSALICSNRLFGIRHDNVSCVDPPQYYSFSSVRYSDSYAIRNLNTARESYCDYIVSVGNNKSNGNILSASLVGLLPVLSFFLHICML